MSTGKGLRSRRDPHLPGFIRSAKNGGDQTQVCVRIPQTLRDSFEKAQCMLRERGKEMQLADVVRLAIEDACRLVTELYGDELSEAGKENSQGVEHSSHGPVEEWGAKKNGGVSSTKSEAPTPQGSRTTQSVERGGGFDGDEEVSRG